MEFTPLLIRIQEILLAVSIGIQSAETIFGGAGLRGLPGFRSYPPLCRRVLQCFLNPRSFRLLHLLRWGLAIGMFFMPSCVPIVTGLLGLQFLLAFKHRGAYNGGSDFMTAQGLLVVFAVAASGRHPLVSRWVLGYVGMQSILSYFLSGVHKILQTEWRHGRALAVLIRAHAEGANAHWLRLLEHPGVARLAAAGVLCFELSFPVVLAGPRLAWIYFTLGLFFHFCVFRIFGLNRFFWAWLASYPSIYYLSVQGWIAH
jgi:hypothetical protein